MPRPRLIVLLALSTIAFVSGCGGGGTAATTTSAPSATASPTATSQAAFFLAVNDRLLALPRLVTTTTTPTETATVSREGADAVQFETTSQYGSATAVELGGETWAKGDEGFWRLSVVGSDPAVAAELAGRWVLVTGTSTATSLDPSPEVPFRHPDDTTPAGSDTVDGVPVDLYDDPVAGSTISLTTGDAPLPVRIESPNSTVITFAVPETALQIAAPPAAEVVDGRDRVR